MAIKTCHLFGSGAVLPVTDIPATMTYYREYLGFAGEGVWGEPPTHGDVTRDRVGIQFTKAPDGFDATSYPGWTYIFVENIDQLYEEYCSKGVTMLREIESHAHDMREFEIQDLNGFRLRFGQYLET